MDLDHVSAQRDRGQGRLDGTGMIGKAHRAAVPLPEEQRARGRHRHVELDEVDGSQAVGDFRARG